MISKNGKATGKIVHQLCCAVYTRKSTGEGLEQEFNSLDAQRESGENYIKSQVTEGWVYLPDRYDHGGFSGGTISIALGMAGIHLSPCGGTARRNHPACRPETT